MPSGQLQEWPDLIMKAKEIAKENHGGEAAAPGSNHTISILWILPVLGETEETERREVEENMST